MGFATVLVDAPHAALEDTEKALNRVGMNDATAPFELAMVNTLMAGKLSANLFVVWALSVISAVVLRMTLRRRMALVICVVRAVT